MTTIQETPEAQKERLRIALERIAERKDDPEYQNYVEELFREAKEARRRINEEELRQMEARSAQNALSLPKAHDRFVRTLENLLLLPVFSYSEEAETVYQTFAPATLRIGPQDCRIAAQALAHNMTVVTRNLRDFQAIGAPCEDWSAE